MATHVQERAQSAVASPHDQNGQTGMVVGAEAPRRGPVRSEAHDERMLAKQNPLFLGEALCVRVDRHLVAPGAIGHRRGPRLHVMQQPLQKVDLILPAHRTSPAGYGLKTDHSVDTVPYQYHLQFRFSIRYRIAREHNNESDRQYGALSIEGVEAGLTRHDGASVRV